MTDVVRIITAYCSCGRNTGSAQLPLEERIAHWESQGHSGADLNRRMSQWIGSSIWSRGCCRTRIISPQSKLLGDSNAGRIIDETNTIATNQNFGGFIQDGPTLVIASDRFQLPQPKIYPEIPLLGAMSSGSAAIYGSLGGLSLQLAPSDQTSQETYAVQLAYYDPETQTRGPYCSINSELDQCPPGEEVHGAPIYDYGDANLGWVFRGALDPKYQVQVFKRPFHYVQGADGDVTEWLPGVGYIAATEPITVSANQRSLIVLAGDW